MGKRKKGFASDAARRGFFARMNQNSSLTMDRSEINRNEHVAEPDYINHYQKREKLIGKKINPDTSTNEKSTKPSTEKKVKSTPEINVESQRRLNKFLNNNSLLNDKIKKLNPEQIAGAIALTTSVVTGNPIPIIIYKGYKVYKFSKQLNQKFSETNLENELLKLTKKTVNETTQKLADNQINDISNKLTKSSQDIGLLRFISEHSHYDESAVKILFKNTVDDTLSNGLEKVTNFTVEAVL